MEMKSELEGNLAMLVLSRQIDESIIIDLGNDEIIKVTVVDIRGDKVRLGVSSAGETQSTVQTEVEGSNPSVDPYYYSNFHPSNRSRDHH